MLVQGTTAHRVPASAEHKLILSVLLALVAMVGLGSALQAQADQGSQSSQKQTQTPPAADTASVLADMARNQEVSTESLRRLRFRTSCFARSPPSNTSM